MLLFVACVTRSTAGSFASRAMSAAARAAGTVIVVVRICDCVRPRVAPCAAAEASTSLAAFAGFNFTTRRTVAPRAGIASAPGVAVGVAVAVDVAVRVAVAVGSAVAVAAGVAVGAAVAAGVAVAVGVVVGVAVVVAVAVGVAVAVAVAVAVGVTVAVAAGVAVGAGAAVGVAVAAGVGVGVAADAGCGPVPTELVMSTSAIAANIAVVSTARRPNSGRPCGAGREERPGCLSGELFMRNHAHHLLAGGRSDRPHVSLSAASIRRGRLRTP